MAAKQTTAVAFDGVADCDGLQWRWQDIGKVAREAENHKFTIPERRGEENYTMEPKSSAKDHKTGGAATKKRQWVANTVCTPLTEDEIKGARKSMEADLLKGKTPAKGRMPRLIVAIGAPGSGKSTITSTVAKLCHKHNPNEFPPESAYVNFDFDALIKYHPRTRNVWNIPDMEGKPTGIGLATGWNDCLDSLLMTGGDLQMELFKEGYDIILQTHNQQIVRLVQMFGYFCICLYVGASLETAKKRAKTRALETGMFIAPTLEEQDKNITLMWNDYRQISPWIGLWADIFIGANNDTKDKIPAEEDYIIIDSHGATHWRENINRMYAVVEAVHR